jgi:U4/U6.U5 tri-snRNP-associated protein 1
LAEKQRLKENLDNKIRKPKYDPYADEYDDDTGEKKLLSKYDDENEAQKRKTFVLGKDQPSSKSTKQNLSTASGNLTAISLDYDRPTEIASDYVDPSTIKIKKPKKKRAKTTTSAAAILDNDVLLPDGASEGMAEQFTPIPLSSLKRTLNEDSGFGDDEELQAMLAQRRRQAVKKRKFTQPEDIVRNLREYKDEEAGPQSGGLVIDDTSEFVRGIEMTQQETPAERRRRSQSNMEVDRVIEPADIEMLDADVVIREDSLPLNENITSNGLDEESLIAAGSMAATLAALKRTGISMLHKRFNIIVGQLEQSDVSSHFTIEELQRREEIIARQRLRKVEQEEEARRQREQERQNERFKRMSQRERELHREQVNQARERAEAQRRMQEFNEFKFNVDVEYKDEFGEEMSKKDVIPSSWYCLTCRRLNDFHILSMVKALGL